MLSRSMLLASFPVLLAAAPEWLLIRTTDGTSLEGRAEITTIRIENEGRPVQLRSAEISSIHSGAPASAAETETINAGLAAIQASNRQARDRAVEELTAIGIPALSPLLKSLKDTDQHEPRPLYRLFERIMPSRADGVDRSLSLVRLQNGTAIRGTLPEGSIDLRKVDGGKVAIPWSAIRSVAIRKKVVKRAMPVHSLRHSTQIEYLDTGVAIGASSTTELSAEGFARLSWNEDGWASDPDGLKKPGSASYKTNLVDGFPFGALVGRVGATGEVFLVGKKAAKTGLPAGRLRLAINDNAHWQNNVGSYFVTLTATDAYDVGDPQ